MKTSFSFRSLFSTVLVSILCSFAIADTAPGSIIINGDIMGVISENESPIQGLSLFNISTGEVYPKSGCGRNDCSYDISDVRPGCYRIVVKTNLGVEYYWGCKS